MLLSLILPLMAAASPEEEALAKLMAGDARGALSALIAARKESPDLERSAAALALREGLPTRDLLEGPEGWRSWAKVQQLQAKGKNEEALKQTLALLEQNVQGAARQAVAARIGEWALLRMKDDPAEAASMLQIALNAAPYDAQGPLATHLLETQTQDVLSRQITLARLLKDPKDPLAWMNIALDAEGGRAWSILSPLISVVSPNLRTSIMQLLLAHANQGELPVSLWLNTWMGMSVEERELGNNDLSFLNTLADIDPVAVRAALPHLMTDPKNGMVIAQLNAVMAPDPATARKAWLALADQAGASSVGQDARNRAIEAGIQQLTQSKNPAEVAKQLALSSDMAGNALVLYHLSPQGSERLPALRALAQRFPEGGPWCAEVLTAALDDGSAEVLKAAAETCGNVDGDDAMAVRTLASGEPLLFAEPFKGALRLRASGDVEVSQVVVNPLALLQAAPGHPLDALPDAFLLDPSQRWNLKATPNKTLSTHQVQPKKCDLAVLTIRMDDLQLSRLVPTHPLNLQVRRLGSQIFVAGFAEGATKPARGVLTTWDGTETKSIKPDKDGVFRFSSDADLKLMLKGADGLGFTTVSALSSTETANWASIVLPDRAMAAAGLRPVQFFGVGAATVKSMSGDRILQSKTVKLDENPLVELYLVPGGRVVVERPGFFTQMPVPWSGSTVPFEVVVSTENPQSVKTNIYSSIPIPPEGLEVSARLYGMDREVYQTTVVKSWPLALEFPTIGIPAGTTLHLNIVAAEQSIAANIQIPEIKAPVAPAVPPWLTLGTPLTIKRAEGVWLKATNNQHTVWAAPDEDLILPHEGAWGIVAWQEGRASLPSHLSVLGANAPLDQDGTWKGPPTLLLLGDQAEVVREGEVLLPGPHAGWLAGPGINIAFDPITNKNLRTAAPPNTALNGSLTREADALKAAIRLEAPKGSKIWAWVRDASDRRELPQAIGFPQEQIPEMPVSEDPFTASPSWGEALAPGLLAEEERGREASQMERVNFGFDPSKEEVGAMGGASGYGMGGGGYGGGLGGIGYASDTIVMGVAAGRMHYEGGLLGRYEGDTGVWNVTLPKTLTRASVQMVIQTPDGRWVEQMETFEAPGTPSALPISLPEPYFDGHLLSGWQPEEVQSKSPLETLANLATQLPIDAWMVAWSGFSEAEQARHYIEMKADGAVSRALSRLQDPSLPRPDAQGVLAEMAAVPENDLAGRALAALAAADGAPDRALVSARRLLREANIDPWIRGRVALTLYLAGAPEDEVDNALGEGNEPALRLSRSLIKAPEKADIALYWQVAQSPGADALDRALAIRALARLNAPAIAKGEASKLESGIAAVHLQPPIAAWQGHYMTRGNTASEYEQPPLADITHLPQGSILPLLVDLKPSILPRTLACPEATPAAQRFQAIAASSQSTQAYCWVYVTDPKIDLSVHLTDPLGNDAGQQTITVTVDAPRSTQLSDAMSLDERLDWVQRLAEAGEVSMFDPLDQLARVEGLSPEMATVLARTRLDLARKVINYDKILTAFETLRERDPAADLSLEVAYDVTRAYAAAGEQRRALSAAKLVLDVSFSQNLEPVRELQHLGMELSAAKLLKEMIAEQPDLPTVQQGRLLLARMLLSRADDGGDTMGYTRSSLRHTAAAELSALLITDPDGPLASEIAGDLGSVLQQIGDQRRLSLLVGPLFNHYQDSASGEPLRALYAWNLLNAGLSDKALSILETADQSGQPALLRGWAYEQKGDWEKAVSAYSYAYSSEAQARLNRLYARRLSEMPLAQVENGRLLTTLAPNEKVRVRAWPLSLERLLLRDGGEVLPDQVLLDGLPGGQEHTAKADGDGHLPLPKLGTGAWLLSLATDNSTVRSIYIASPLTLEVSNGERPLIVVRQDSKPVAHATVWWFRTDGSSGRAETGADGTIWADAPITRVVAQAGSRYGLSAPTAAPAPAPAYPSPAPMEAAKQSYDFDNLRSLGYIDASML